MKLPGQRLDLPLGWQEEAAEDAGSDRPEIAALLAERILQEKGAGIEQPRDLFHVQGGRRGDGGIARVETADLGLDAVELGEQGSDLPSQGLGLGAALLYLLIGLGAQAVAQGLPPREQIGGSGVAGVGGPSGAEDVEQAARADPFADLESRPVLSLSRLGGMAVHVQI